MDSYALQDLLWNDVIWKWEALWPRDVNFAREPTVFGFIWGGKERSFSWLSWKTRKESGEVSSVDTPTACAEPWGLFHLPSVHYKPLARKSPILPFHVFSLRLFGRSVTYTTWHHMPFVSIHFISGPEGEEESVPSSSIFNQRANAAVAALWWPDVHWSEGHSLWLTRTW